MSTKFFPMNPMSDIEKRRRYDALPTLPLAAAFEDSWIDRVQTFALFLENGATCAALLREFDVYERERARANELYDLLMDAFPPDS